jgi:hypothetical protein
MRPQACAGDAGRRLANAATCACGSHENQYESLYNSGLWMIFAEIFDADLCLPL